MAIKIDPQHPGAVLRFFLIAEAIINLIEGAIFFCVPNYFLRMVLAEGTAIGPAHEALLRIFAIILVCFITIQTAFCAANTPRAIEGRKVLYLGYAVVEAVGIAFFWYMSILGPEASGFDFKSIRFVAKQLILPFVGRLIPLWRPDYFGKYIVVDDKKGKKS